MGIVLGSKCGRIGKQSCRRWRCTGLIALGSGSLPGEVGGGDRGVVSRIVTEENIALPIVGTDAKAAIDKCRIGIRGFGSVTENRLLRPEWVGEILLCWRLAFQASGDGCDVIKLDLGEVRGRGWTSWLTLDRSR